MPATSSDQQPGPPRSRPRWTVRRTRADARGLPPHGRRTPRLSRAGDRVVFGRRCPDRLRRTGPHRPGLDLRHQRRPGTPDDPALDRTVRAAGADGRAHRSAYRSHDRAYGRAGVPGGDRAVRARRTGVGPHLPVVLGVVRSDGLDRPVQAAAPAAPQWRLRPRRPPGPGRVRPRRGLRGPQPRGLLLRPADRVPRRGAGFVAPAGPGPVRPLLGVDGPAAAVDLSRRPAGSTALTVPGSVLSGTGLTTPRLRPSQAVVLELRTVD